MVITKGHWKPVTKCSPILELWSRVTYWDRRYINTGARAKQTTGTAAVGSKGSWKRYCFIPELVTLSSDSKITVEALEVLFF